MTKTPRLILSISALTLSALTAGCGTSTGEVGSSVPRIEASVEGDFVVIDDRVLELAVEDATLVVAYQGEVVGEIDRGGIFETDEGESFAVATSVELEADLLEGMREGTMLLDVVAITDGVARVVGTLVPPGPQEQSLIAVARCGTGTYPWERDQASGCCSANRQRRRHYRCRNTSGGGVTYHQTSVYCVNNSSAC